MSENKKIKVLLTTNIPSPYFVEYADCLGKKCDLTVLFELKRATNRKNDWYGQINYKSFKMAFLNAKPFSAEAGLSFKIIKYLKSDFDRIIIANPLTPTGIVALLYCRIKKIPFILQSEGGFRGSERGLKERFKKFLMEKATLYLSGMKGEWEYFLSYGATANKLRWYPFTSLTQEEIDKEIITEEEKQSLKLELGIKEEKIVISVGRTIPCKGFDILLKAKKDLPSNVGLYIVGGEITAEYKEIIEENNLKNVHFIDHCAPEVLDKYYHCSDVFVLMTRGDTWGLVINEAMAKGLPVITTDRCVAGLQLIEDGVNGYIIPVDSIEVLRSKIQLLLKDDNICKEMASNNLKKIQPYYIENMANIIFDAISNDI